MSNFSDQIEEIKASISSSTGKSLAYSTLVFLQEQSGEDPGLNQTLVDATSSLVSLIVADIHCEDEEIAFQALKCLGFMVYQKFMVVAISVEGANLVLDSLVKLITTTKIKSVCNLGVWCISIQHFGEQIIASHFNSLLQAVLRSLDNPFGSLSTTFEASQAVMRLAVQSVENMRNSSHVWAPPLYRRLVSLDKRERDMSERCLLKSVSLLIPSPHNLSKALVRDMKQNLLTGMKDLLNSGMKIQAIRAWGWFIKLLGPYALKNRHLVNEMLKIPEHTFSDSDSQLQIATQVAWEGLIDALIHPAILPRERHVDEKNENIGKSEKESKEIQGNGFSKSVKLIMRPLVSIMLAKFDASVHGSCFNTWCYLLHKLDSSVNCLPVKELVLQPMFEAIFQMAPDCKNTWLWNRTIDLLGNSNLANSGDVLDSGASTSENGSCKEYSVKWFPLEPNHLEFHINFVSIFINRLLKSGLAPEEQSFLSGASLRLFRCIAKGVQMILKVPSTTYDDILLCLSAVLKFVKNLWEEHSDGSKGDDLFDILLQLIEVIIEEIEPAMLSSPLYKMALDLGHIKSQTDDNETRHAKIVELCSINHMDMVSPIVYLTVLNFCVTAQSNVNTAQRYRIFMLSSFEPADTFIVTVRLLYKCTGLSCLRLWTLISKALVDCIGDVKSISVFKSESAYVATRDLLCYPFIICSRQSSISQKRNLESEQVIEVWKSLYGLLCSSRYEHSNPVNASDDLCNILGGWLDKYSRTFESTNELDSNHEDQELRRIDFYGDIVISILNQPQSSGLSNTDDKSDMTGCKSLASVNNRITLAIRLMKLLQTRRRNGLRKDFGLPSRLYNALARFIGSHHLKNGDAHSFLEIISSPLLNWLTRIDSQDESEYHQFNLIWKETLDLLRRSRPSLLFDSVLLGLQSALLEKTLDHPNPSISELTISFWNTTYGDQIKLQYPQNLLHVLDKLSREGRVKLCTPSLLGKCSSGSKNLASSKRAEPLKKVLCVNMNMKRKRLELTEHQKEVRRAQRGRERDCGGHGLGGIKTYTSLDFSQGNEDSQDSQDFMNLESILDKFKRR